MKALASKKRSRENADPGESGPQKRLHFHCVEVPMIFKRKPKSAPPKSRRPLAPLRSHRPTPPQTQASPHNGLFQSSSNKENLPPFTGSGKENVLAEPAADTSSNIEVDVDGDIPASTAQIHSQTSIVTTRGPGELGNMSVPLPARPRRNVQVPPQHIAELGANVDDDEEDNSSIMFSLESDEDISDNESNDSDYRDEDREGPTICHKKSQPAKLQSRPFEWTIKHISETPLTSPSPNGIPSCKCQPDDHSPLPLDDCAEPDRSCNFLSHFGFHFHRHFQHIYCFHHDCFIPFFLFEGHFQQLHSKTTSQHTVSKVIRLDLIDHINKQFIDIDRTACCGPLEKKPRALTIIDEMLLKMPELRKPPVGFPQPQTRYKCTLCITAHLNQEGANKHYKSQHCAKDPSLPKLKHSDFPKVFAWAPFSYSNRFIALAGFQQANDESPQVSETQMPHNNLTVPIAHCNSPWVLTLGWVEYFKANGRGKSSEFIDPWRFLRYISHKRLVLGSKEYPITLSCKQIHVEDGIFEIKYFLRAYIHFAGEWIDGKSPVVRKLFSEGTRAKFNRVLLATEKSYANRVFSAVSMPLRVYAHAKSSRVAGEDSPLNLPLYKAQKATLGDLYMYLVNDRPTLRDNGVHWKDDGKLQQLTHKFLVSSILITSETLMGCTTDLALAFLNLTPDGQIKDANNLSRDCACFQHALFFVPITLALREDDHEETNGPLWPLPITREMANKDGGNPRVPVIIQDHVDEFAASVEGNAEADEADLPPGTFEDQDEYDEDAEDDDDSEFLVIQDPADENTTTLKSIYYEKYRTHLLPCTVGSAATPGPFASMKMAWFYAMPFAQNMTSKILVTWSPDGVTMEFSTPRIDARALTIDNFRELRRYLDAKLREQVKDLLPRGTSKYGVQYSDLAFSIVEQITKHHLHDNPAKAQDASLLSFPENSLVFDEASRRIMDAYKDSQEEHKLFQLGSKGMSSAKTFLMQLQQFMATLLSSLATSMGLPPRATSIAEYRYRPDSQEKRHWFAGNDTESVLAWAPEKTERRRGWREGSLHPLTETLDWALRILIVLFRPVQRAILISLRGGSTVNIEPHDSYIFVDENGPWTSRRINCEIRNHTAHFLGTGIGVPQLRQILSAFFKRHHPDLIFVPQLDGMTISNIALNHNNRTAQQNYGLDNLTPGSKPREICHHFIRIGHVWQAAIGARAVNPHWTQGVYSGNHGAGPGGIEEAYKLAARLVPYQYGIDSPLLDIGSRIRKAKDLYHTASFVHFRDSAGNMVFKGDDVLANVTAFAFKGTNPALGRIPLDGYSAEVVATAALAITKVLDDYMEPDRQSKSRTSQEWRERYSALYNHILALLETYKKEDEKEWMVFSQKVYEIGSVVPEQSRLLDGSLAVSEWGAKN